MNNTCVAFATELGSGFRALVYYSHLIPVAIGFFLSVFVLIKSKWGFLPKIFSLFTIGFCLWLIGDLIIWISPDYNLISLSWSLLDYINILFYLFGAYFFAALIRGGDVPIWQKLMFALVSLPAWWLVVTYQSALSFNEPLCESINNSFLTQYKLILEIGVLVFIILLGGIYWHKASRELKKQILLIGSALFIFLTTFGLTEYISSTTGSYDINLYSLFVLPVFLFMIIYSITNMKAFNLRSISTQLLTYVMIILVGSQFFFLENTTNQILTVGTFVLALSFGVVLSRDAKREAEQRDRLELLTKELETANEQLKVLSEQKSQFLSFASHDLKSPINIIKQFASLIADGTYKEPAKVQETILKIKSTADRATNLVDDFLDIRKIEEGKMDYTFETKDIVSFIKGTVEDYAPVAKAQKNIDLSFATTLKTANVKIDTTRFRQVIQNLLSNSLKYTEAGWIKVMLTDEQSTVLISVKDSGIGMSAELLPTLFEQFHREKNIAKKIQGTGLGLYISKQIVQAHGGETWAQSEGPGKGSAFFVRLKKA